MQDIEARKKLHLYKEGDCWIKPHATYTLTLEDRKNFCEFLKSVCFPDGFALILRKNIIDENNKITRLKSHNCYVIMQTLLLTGI